MHQRRFFEPIDRRTIQMILRLLWSLVFFIVSTKTCICSHRYNCNTLRDIYLINILILSSYIRFGFPKVCFLQALQNKYFYFYFLQALILSPDISLSASVYLERHSHRKLNRGGHTDLFRQG